METKMLQKLKELDDAISICNRAADEAQSAREVMTILEPIITNEPTRIHNVIRMCKDHLKNIFVELPPADTPIVSVANKIMILETQLNQFEPEFNALLKKLSDEIEEIEKFRTELEDKRRLTSRATTVEVIEQAIVHWPKWRTSNSVEKSQSMVEEWHIMNLDKKIFECFGEILSYLKL